MKRKIWKPFGIILPIAVLVIGAFLIWERSWQTNPQPDLPVSTHNPEPGGDSSYWDGERTKSATPAPMPPP